jgi:hypothetical protein
MREERNTEIVTEALRQRPTEGENWRWADLLEVGAYGVVFARRGAGKALEYDEK